MRAVVLVVCGLVLAAVCCVAQQTAEMELELDDEPATFSLWCGKPYPDPNGAVRGLPPAPPVAHRAEGLGAGAGCLRAVRQGLVPASTDLDGSVSVLVGLDWATCTAQHSPADEFELRVKLKTSDDGGEALVAVQRQRVAPGQETHELRFDLDSVVADAEVQIVASLLVAAAQQGADAADDDEWMLLDERQGQALVYIDHSAAADSVLVDNCGSSSVGAVLVDGDRPFFPFGYYYNWGGYLRTLLLRDDAVPVCP
jgi:hypothetical protein